MVGFGQALPSPHQVSVLYSFPHTTFIEHLLISNQTCQPTVYPRIHSKSIPPQTLSLCAFFFFLFYKPRPINTSKTLVAMNRVPVLKSFLHRFRAIHTTTYKQFSEHGESQLLHSGPVASLLKSRGIIRFRGPDTLKFLQGLLTNDVRSFGEPVGDKTAHIPTPNVPASTVSPLYAAFLTPQGRFLYDLFLYKPPRPDAKLDDTGTAPGSDPNEPFDLFADGDASVLDELLQTFKKYRLRSKVDIDNVTEDFSCWQRYGGDLPEKSSDEEEPEAASVGWGAAADKTAMSASHGGNIGWQWFKDPRLLCLGFRGIFPSNTIPPLVEADKETDERNYLLWRIEQGVAEGSTEIPKGEAVPLEYNLAALNAISFDKGCYVGQELIARTHHRGVIRKRVVPLRFLDNDGKELESKVIPGSEVMNTASGKKVGTVTTAIGSRGLGLLRLEEAFKGSNTLSIQGQDGVKVVANKPDWWPSEWLQDHQQNTAFA